MSDPEIGVKLVTRGLIQILRVDNYAPKRPPAALSVVPHAEGCKVDSIAPKTAYMGSIAVDWFIFSSSLKWRLIQRLRPTVFCTLFCEDGCLF